MGQRLTGVAGRSLMTGNNGYEARRQLDPEELKAYLRPLYQSLLREIGYVAAVSLDTTAVAKLHKVMQEKANATGLDYLINPISSKGFTLGLSLACVRKPSSKETSSHGPGIIPIRRAERRKLT